MPITGLHHIDLAVSDVERSLDFYRGVLGPLGLKEAARYPRYHHRWEGSGGHATPRSTRVWDTTGSLF